MPLVFLPSNLSRLTEFAAGEDGRYAMTGVRLCLPPGTTQQYRLEATNGKFLAVVKGEFQIPCGGDWAAIKPMQERAETLPSDAREALIDSVDWKKGLALANNRQFHGVGLCLGEQRVSFLSRESVYHATPMEGRFPDVRQCIPRCQEGSVSFRINSQQLLPIAHLAKALEMEALEVIYYGPNVPIGFSGRNRQGQVLDCLLVPLTTS